VLERPRLQLRDHLGASIELDARAFGGISCADNHCPNKYRWEVAMTRGLMFVNVLATAGFAGGCLLLSGMLSGLFGVAPEESARIMHMLLPRMGRVMAPLLVIGGLSSLILAVRAAPSLRRTRWIVAAAFVAIAFVTVSVHLPLNAYYLEHTSWPAAQASLLERWLLWHHLRTALALSALTLLLWPRAIPSEPRISVVVTA
jgi:uncharacterized membrane protein